MRFHHRFAKRASCLIGIGSHLQNCQHSSSANKMVFGGAIFVVISVLFVVSDAMPRQNQGDKGQPLHNFVLMPVKYADNMLKKDFVKVEKVRKESYAVLKDLQDNREKYPTKVVGHAVAKVIEKGAETLLTSFRDIQTLIYPNAVI